MLQERTSYNLLKWDPTETARGRGAGLVGGLAHWSGVNTGSSDPAADAERKLGSRAVANGCRTRYCSFCQQLAAEIWPAGVQHPIRQGTMVIRVWVAFGYPDSQAVRGNSVSRVRDAGTLSWLEGAFHSWRMSCQNKAGP